MGFFYLDVYYLKNRKKKAFYFQSSSKYSTVFKLKTLKNYKAYLANGLRSNPFTNNSGIVGRRRSIKGRIASISTSSFVLSMTQKTKSKELIFQKQNICQLSKSLPIHLDGRIRSTVGDNHFLLHNRV